MPSNFMTWVDHLPEVGEPIRKERDRLATKLHEAYLLERRAAHLLAEARAGELDLLATVARKWSLFEIESAGRRAGVERRALALATVRDDALRVGLQLVDDHLTASEAVRIFGQADVIRSGTLLHASEPERLATLDRVIAWWTFAGKAVYERLEKHPPVPGAARQLVADA